MTLARPGSTEVAIEILDKVFFETGKAQILERSHPLLSDVAVTMLAHGVERVEVQGHTDSRGSDERTLVLSRERAQSVRTFLIEAGVPAERLVAVGYGESMPVADNGTVGGRSQNRRVEFRIEPSKAEPDPR